jgi:hypothetical protein
LRVKFSWVSGTGSAFTMLARAARELAVVVNTSNDCDSSFDFSAAITSRRDERRSVTRLLL